MSNPVYEDKDRIILEYEKRINQLEKANQNLQEAFKELTVLQDLTKVITSTHDFDKIMERLVNLVGDFLKYRWCALLIWDNKNERFDFGAVAGECAEMHQVIEDHEAEHILEWAMESSRPISLPYENPKEGSYVLAPLVGMEKPLGVLHVSTYLVSSDFDEQRFQILHMLTSQAAIAIDNANLIKQMQDFVEYLNNIIEGFYQGVVVLDRAGTITLMNQRVRDILQINRIETWRVHYTELFPENVSTLLHPLFAEVMMGGEVLGHEIEYVRSDDTTVPISVSATMLRDPNYEIRGIILIVRDLSESMELRELRRLDKMKSDLVSRVSHELRTPLTSIKAYTETLLDSVEDGDVETQKEFLCIVDEETDRLSRLISDLLDLSRIERGKFEINFESVTPINLVEKVVKLFQKQTQKHEIILSAPDELQDIPIDKDKVHQVLTNIIGNAIKYSPEGGKVEVVLEKQNDKLMTRVTDEGMGIPDEARLKIFDNFYRVDSALTHEISGTGLGLTISKFIVEKHGGEIGVESVLGEGSTFWFTLPFSRKESEEG